METEKLVPGGAGWHLGDLVQWKVAENCYQLARVIKAGKARVTIVVEATGARKSVRPHNLILCHE